jgi:hypothetical protein
MQISRVAEIIEPFSEEYNKLLEFKKSGLFEQTAAQTYEIIIIPNDAFPFVV